MRLFRLVARLGIYAVLALLALTAGSFVFSFAVGLFSLLVRAVVGEDAARSILGVFPGVFGFVVLAGLLRFAFLANARRWRRVSSCYGGLPSGDGLASRFPEQVVINEGGLKFLLYVPLTVGIHGQGISLRLLAPFSFGCPPIFLPFAELSAKPTWWYLSGKPWGLRAAKAPDVEIIVSDKLWNWIQSNCPPGCPLASGYEVGGQATPDRRGHG